MSFVFAALVVLATLSIAFLQAYAVYMSTTGTGNSGAGWTLGIGFSVASLLILSHWLPSIGW